MLLTASVKDDKFLLFVDGQPLGYVQVERIDLPREGDEFACLRIEAVARGVNVQEVQGDRPYGTSRIMTSIASGSGGTVRVREGDSDADRLWAWTESVS